MGSHLVNQLVAEHRAVRVLEKPGVATCHLPTNEIEIVYADLRDEKAVKEAAVGCGVVLHLAANPNLWARDPNEFEQVNHQGPRRVLAAARSAGAPRRAAFGRLEAAVRRALKGLWGGPIVGNLASKVFHLPRGRFYFRVGSANWVLFAVEAEARGAGYRRSAR